MVAVPRRVTANADLTTRADQVDRTVTLIHGRTLHTFIEHAVGSQDRPMADTQLEDKFTSLADDILPGDRTRRLMELCWTVWDLPGVGEIDRAGAAT